MRSCFAPCCTAGERSGQDFRSPDSLRCTRFLQGGGTELQCALCPQDTFFLLRDFLVLFKEKKKKKQIEKVRKCSLKLIKVSKENEKTSLRTLVWRK